MGPANKPLQRTLGADTLPAATAQQAAQAGARPPHRPNTLGRGGSDRVRIAILIFAVGIATGACRRNVDQPGRIPDDPDGGSVPGRFQDGGIAAVSGSDGGAVADPVPDSAAGLDLDPKDRELATLPVGIRVTHLPDPVRAQLHGRSGRRYTWLYETRVGALSEEISIVEFGALTRNPSRGNRWELHTIFNRPFNAAEFADWYSCPNAVVPLGVDCVDPLNYSGGDALADFETRWYFIGRTRSGRLLKGEARVRGSAEVQNPGRK